MSASDKPDAFRVREAKPADVPAIAELIKPFVEQKHLLPRTQEELSGLVQNGFAAESGSQLIGFACIDIYSNKMAELLCLAVSNDAQGQGVGRELVRRCIECAKRHRIIELMVISSSDRFLMDCGFNFTLPGEKKALFIQTHDPHDPD